MAPKTAAPRPLRPEQAASFLAIAQALLACWQGPDQAHELWALSAEHAPLLHLGEVHPKKQLSEAAFVLAQHSLQALWATHMQRPHFPPEGLRLQEAWQEGEGRAVLWAWAPETSQGQDMALGVGFQREGSTWKVAWSLLEAKAGSWPFAWGHGQQQALAFLLDGFGPCPPRHWLDLAWRRLGGLPQAPFHALPEARFSCQGSTNCCTPGFVNLLPGRAQAFLDALPWGEGLPEPDLGHQLPIDALTGQLLLKDQHESCRFLNAQQRCILHAHLGWQAFPLCANYPIEFVAHPDGVDLSALHSCPSARKGLGLPLLAPEQDRDLRGRLALVQAVEAPPLLHLHPELVVDWPAFRAAEHAVLAALDSPLGVAERLWRAHLALAHHEALWQDPSSSMAKPASPSTEPGHDLFTTWPMRPVVDEARQAAGLAWLWRTMPGLTTGLDAPSLLLDAPGPQAQALAAGMRYLLHRKIPYALHHSLRTQLGAVAVFALQGLSLMAAHPDGQLPDALWLPLMRRFTGAYVFQLMDADPEGARLLLARAGQRDFLPQLVALPTALPLKTPSQEGKQAP